MLKIILIIPILLVCIHRYQLQSAHSYFKQRYVFPNSHFLMDNFLPLRYKIEMEAVISERAFLLISGDKNHFLIGNVLFRLIGSAEVFDISLKSSIKRYLSSYLEWMTLLKETTFKGSGNLMIPMSLCYFKLNSTKLIIHQVLKQHYFWVTKKHVLFK